MFEETLAKTLLDMGAMYKEQLDMRNMYENLAHDYEKQRDGLSKSCDEYRKEIARLKDSVEAMAKMMEDMRIIVSRRDIELDDAQRMIEILLND